jgi:hypothetical protein
MLETNQTDMRQSVNQQQLLSRIPVPYRYQMYWVINRVVDTDELQSGLTSIRITFIPDTGTGTD